MVKAAQCHGKARERKGSARKEKGRAAEKERKKKMGMERMGEFTPWRIFDFTNYSPRLLPWAFFVLGGKKNGNFPLNKMRLVQKIKKKLLT